MVEIDDTNKAPEFPDQDMETDGDQTDQERMVAENTELRVNDRRCCGSHRPQHGHIDLHAGRD